MGEKITEDSRPLHAFYPDPKLRSQIHYGFAHRFLPEYVHGDPGGFLAYLNAASIDPTRFIQSRWQMMEEIISLPGVDQGRFDPSVFRRLTELELWTDEVGGRPAAIIQMPVPERAPLAFFIAVVIRMTESSEDQGHVEASARYFTLERFIGGGGSALGVLGEWTHDRKHITHDLTIPVSREAFIGAVARAIEAERANPAGRATDSER